MNPARRRALDRARGTGTAAERGYGQAHVRSRKQAFAALPELSPCVRCGKPMWKWATEHGRSALHYDHNTARTGYLGFSHGVCNRLAGASRGGRLVCARRRARGRGGTPSRYW